MIETSRRKLFPFGLSRHSKKQRNNENQLKLFHFIFFLFFFLLNTNVVKGMATYLCTHEKKNQTKYTSNALHKVNHLFVDTTFMRVLGERKNRLRLLIYVLVANRFCSGFNCRCSRSIATFKLNLKLFENNTAFFFHDC